MNRRHLLLSAAALPLAARSYALETPCRAPSTPTASTTVAVIPAESPVRSMKVDLRAVAEQTAHESARWTTSFLVRSS
ncbi:MAG TPA: hypothetical protein VGL22_19335 [Terracidiphilus sp.]|jgi:hypothetical protein